MKKTVKYFSLILSVLAISLLFCGCNNIFSQKNMEQAKENRAYFVQNGENLDISFGGATYVYMPCNNDFRPQTPTKRIYVGEEEQPILITMINGSHYFISDNEEFICDKNALLYYFRSDCVDKYSLLMDNHSLTRLGVHIESGNIYSDDYKSVPILLSDNETKIIENTFNASVVTTDTEYENHYFDNAVSFYYMDETASFSEFAFDFLEVKDLQKIYIQTGDDTRVVNDADYGDVSRILEKYRSDVDY